jgi:hypothetical protein
MKRAKSLDEPSSNVTGLIEEANLHNSNRHLDSDWKEQITLLQRMKTALLFS